MRQMPLQDPEHSRDSGVPPSAQQFIMLLGLTAAVTAWSGYFAWRAWMPVGRLLRASQRYAQTTGTIESHDLRLSPQGDAEPVIEYSFTVGGRIYWSQRVAFGQSTAMTASQARELLDRHSPGEPVAVYYDPADPNQAVLEMRLPTIQWIHSAAVLPFLALAVILLIFTMRMGKAVYGRPAG